MRKTPLVVHFVFHPESEKSRSLAKHIHRALNDDAVVPGLRIPTVFCAADGSGPPAKHELDQAQRNFVVPLADDELNAEDEWCRFVADLWEECRSSAQRCVPVQLSEHAWPLDRRLSTVNFLRAYREKEANRADFVVRRLTIELCRYLHGDETGGDGSQVQVRLFISHTKSDLAVEPRVVEKLHEYLKADQPVKGWVDSGDIPAGSMFTEEIEKGTKDTSLLCVLTDQYATREWCRKEVLLAKKNQRPVVVIDALNEYEVRSFPYLGNVPVVRWRGQPEAAIDLLLKETLRHLHAREILAPWKEPGDEIFVSPPELATLIDIPKKVAVLYPDPPVGAEEKRLLMKTGVTATTPLERLAREHPLTGKSIALSLSESTDIRRFGLDELHQESVALELSRYLLIKGATLAYGGHLGSEGYTAKLFELVRTYNEREGVKPFERIVNYLGWPLPRPDVQARSRYKNVATWKPIARPVGLDESLHADFLPEPSFFPGDRSREHRYAWARGMTAMREAETSDTCARIVVGGTFGPTEKALPDGTREQKWYFGRVPGLLEEVLTSAKAGQPVFLIGAFGGVARLVIDLLAGQDRAEATWAYQKNAPFATEMRAFYEERGEEWWDYAEMVEFLRNKGAKGLNPCLTEEEHRVLFHTRDPVRMVELILLGLSRIESGKS